MAGTILYMLFYKHPAKSTRQTHERCYLSRPKLYKTFPVLGGKVSRRLFFLLENEYISPKRIHTSGVARFSTNIYKTLKIPKCDSNCRKNEVATISVQAEKRRVKI